VAPPESVTSTLETRIANTISVIFWLARLERQDGTQQVQSGISKAYEFEKTNRRLGDFARQIAKADKASLMLVGRLMGLGADALEQMAITPPEDFRVEDLTTDLANALSAMELGLPPTVEHWIKMRVVEKMLPNLPEAEKKLIEQEMLKQRDEAAQVAAEQREIDAAAGDEDEDEDASEEDPEE
jgi:hypothetical protein